MYPNTYMMATPTNVTDTSTYMYDDSLYILINAAVKEPRYDPGQQVNGLFFLSKISINADDDNTLLTRFILILPLMRVVFPTKRLFMRDK